MNIRVRLTIWYTAILTLILVIFSGAVYLGLSRSLTNTLDNNLKREAAQVIGGLKFEGRDDDKETKSTDNQADFARSHQLEVNELEVNHQPEEEVLWRILDPEGRPLVDPGQLAGVPIAPELIGSDFARFEYAGLPNQVPIRLYSVPFVIEGEGAGIVQVAERYSHIQEVERLLLLLVTLGLPLTLLGASVGGWFLASRALNPIDRMTRAAQQISADDLHQRLNLHLPNDEVGRLAVTFDQMLARLEDTFEGQKRFIADASHELRTPLTILKGDVEVALHRPRTAAEYRESLKMINQTANRLTSLVEELFLLARADNHQLPLRLEQFNLAELLSQQVAHMLPQALGKKIALNLDTPASLTIVADPVKLARLSLNLIDNAIKYANPGDSVEVLAALQNGHIRISVADTGPGIPPEHLSRLFERFYRVDQARSRAGVGEAASSSGAGLGLSIVDLLVKAHGGRIEVTSQVDQGSTFTVWLPLKPSAGN